MILTKEQVLGAFTDLYSVTVHYRLSLSQVNEDGETKDTQLGKYEDVGSSSLELGMEPWWLSTNKAEIERNSDTKTLIVSTERSVYADRILRRVCDIGGLLALVCSLSLALKTCFSAGKLDSHLDS